MLQLNTIIILCVLFSLSASFSCPTQRTLAQQDKFNVKNHHHDSTHSGKNMFKLILIEADFFIYHPISLSLFFSLSFSFYLLFSPFIFSLSIYKRMWLNKLKIINKNKIKIYSLARFVSLYFTVAVFIYRIFYSYRFVSVFYQLKPSISRQYSMEFIGLHAQPFSTQI